MHVRKETPHCLFRWTKLGQKASFHELRLQGHSVSRRRLHVQHMVPACDGWQKSGNLERRVPSKYNETNFMQMWLLLFACKDGLKAVDGLHPASRQPGPIAGDAFHGLRHFQQGWGSLGPLPGSPSVTTGSRRVRRRTPRGCRGTFHSSRLDRKDSRSYAARQCLTGIPSDWVAHLSSSKAQ